jgi:TIR domain
MAVPLVLFVIGAGLAAVPVRNSGPIAHAAVAEPGTPATGSRISGAVGQPPPAVAKPPGHAFLCYVREDAPHTDQLQRDLEAAGISVWRDTADVWPGEDWRMKIRRAITDNALVFIACFSAQSTTRIKSHQNEELILAIDQLRMRRSDVPWLIPVRFDDCLVPDLDLGGGRTLASIQHVDLFGQQRDAAVMRLVTTVRRLLGQDWPETSAG